MHNIRTFQYLSEKHTKSYVYMQYVTVLYCTEADNTKSLLGDLYWAILQTGNTESVLLSLAVVNWLVTRGTCVQLNLDNTTKIGYKKWF